MQCHRRQYVGGDADQRLDFPLDAYQARERGYSVDRVDQKVKIALIRVTAV